MLKMTVNKLAKETGSFYTPQAIYKKIKTGKWKPETDITGQLILPKELEEAFRRGKKVRWQRDIISNHSDYAGKHIQWVVWNGEMFGIIKD